MTTQLEHWLRESTDAKVLTMAGRDGNALTLWHRQPAADLVAAVQALPHAALPDGRLNGSVQDFTDWLDEHLMSVPAAYRDHLAVIADDMHDVARAFAAWLQASVYTFRCHRLDSTMCPRFHTDFGAMRLLCTYRGPGTQWVPEHAVDRRALNTIGTDNDAIVPDIEEVKVVPPFTVAVLCGGDAKGLGGVVHRSPMIPEGGSRLTFCMSLV